MSNTLLTPSIIAKEALMQLTNNMVMGANVHRDYKKEFVKVGDTVSIRKPVKFVASDGATRVNQDVTETSTSLTINKRKHVSWNFSSQDLTLKIEDYSERYITPAAIALANQIDQDLCALYVDCHNVVGTPGTTPATFAALASVAQRLDEGAVPRDARRMVLNPAAHWGLVGGDLKGLFNENLVKDLVRKGYLGTVAQMDFLMDQNIQAHTCGTRTATGGTLSATATEASSAIAITGAGASATVKKGDVFTVAGCYAVNPTSRQSTGILKQFVVTADLTLNGSGAGTLAVAPAIYAAGGANDAYATVSALPASGAAVVFVGATGGVYPMNLGFHKNAFALVTCPLQVPDGVAFSSSETYEGVNIRVVKDYDITNDLEIIRLDILYGCRTIYPDLALRLAG